MPRIILLLLLLALAVFVINRYRKMPPEKQRHLLKVIMLAGLGALLVILVLTGRLSWLIAAVGALLPLLPRAAKLLLSVWPSVLPYFRRYQQNKQSRMQTLYIKLQIDVVTGELKGEVLLGQFKGDELQLMTLDQLIALLQECKQQDGESAALLISYLDQTHRGWSGDDAEAYHYTPPVSDMTEQQAREILGVSDSADSKEIIKAHKRLIQKLHPDRGGSDFLAKQINLAKDLLLK